MAKTETKIEEARKKANFLMGSAITMATAAAKRGGYLEASYMEEIKAELDQIFHDLTEEES